MIDYGKRQIMDVLVDAVDMDAAVERVTHYARYRRPCTVAALAAHGIVEARHDERLAASLNYFDLVIPDGQPVRWALNALYGLDLPDKVPGPSLMDHLLAWAAGVAAPVHFYGSTPATLEGMAAALEQRFGGRLPVTTSPSIFRMVAADDLGEVAASINDTGASLCFVGLGCPRQERFVSAIGPRLNMPAVAVGAAFDYTAGSISRAPEVLQKLGLEWAYRLSQEPRRLARRYITTNTEFILGVGAQAASQRVSRSGSTPAPAPPDALPWAAIDA